MLVIGIWFITSPPLGKVRSIVMSMFVGCICLWVLRNSQKPQVKLHLICVHVAFINSSRILLSYIKDQQVLIVGTFRTAVKL